MVVVIIAIIVRCGARCVGGGRGCEDHPEEFRIDVMSVWRKDEAFDDAFIGNGWRAFHGGR